MKMIKTLLGCSIAALMLVVVIGCGKKDAVKTETIAEIQAREGIPVTVTVMEPRPFQVIAKEGGTVIGYNQTDLNAMIPAQITAIHVRVGSYVKAGDVLIELDQTSLYAKYAEVKKQIDQAQKSYDRMAALHDEGAVSEDVFENATTQLDVAKVQLAKLNETVNILAPFNGTIVAVNARVDDKLNPPNGGGPGPPPALVIARLDRIQIDMQVNEVAIGNYRKNQKASITVAGKKITGAISSVALSGDRMSHSFGVEALFRNPGKVLKPGMFVTVHTVVYAKKSAMSIPVVALQQLGETPAVYIAVDGLAKKVAITLGKRGTESFEVLDGLVAGDAVIIRGTDRIADGTKIKVIK